MIEDVETFVKEFTEVQFKVDTMWDSIMKRGIVEAVNRGLMTVNSPVRLTHEGASAIETLTPVLRNRYEKEWCNFDERQLAYAIEHEYGTQIIKEVCIPEKISYMSCIAIAVAVAKGTNTLTEILDNVEEIRKRPIPDKFHDPNKQLPPPPSTT